jgi:hypothetical protein
MLFKAKMDLMLINILLKGNLRKNLELLTEYKLNILKEDFKSFINFINNCKDLDNKMKIYNLSISRFNNILNHSLRFKIDDSKSLVALGIYGKLTFVSLPTERDNLSNEITVLKEITENNIIKDKENREFTIKELEEETNVLLSLKESTKKLLKLSENLIESIKDTRKEFNITFNRVKEASYPCNNKENQDIKRLFDLTLRLKELLETPLVDKYGEISSKIELK